MRNMPHVVSAMTPFPHTIEADKGLSEAKALMYGNNIRHLPVIDDGKLAGILTDRDLKLALSVCDEKEADSLKVGDICVYDVYIVEHSERLDRVLRRMVEQHIGSALVVRNGKLVGIFTSTDACRKLEEILRIQYPDA